MLVKILKEIIKNIIIIIVSLFFIVTITFFIFEIVPGEMYNLDYIKNENVIENIREKYNLDKPMHIRYFKTLVNTFTFDFGNSFINEGRSVNDIIKDNLPISTVIGISAVVISLIAGTVIGYKMSEICKKSERKIVLLILILLTSIPTFVLSIILQYFFGVYLKILPVLGTQNLSGYILPILILSISPTIFTARLVEKRVTEIRNSDFVIAAKVRGISKNTIIFKYILKNTITPVLSYIAPIMANLLVGSFVIESIFNIPGLGRYFITSITNRDYPVVMGLTIFFSIILITITSIMNVIISIIDYKGDIIGEK